MNFIVSLLLLLSLLVDINGFKASRPRLIGKAATSSKSESLKLNRFQMFDVDRNDMQQNVFNEFSIPIQDNLAILSVPGGVNINDGVNSPFVISLLAGQFILLNLGLWLGFFTFTDVGFFQLFEINSVSQLS